ncbi:CLUMA_CG003161, isoform A [Clunio marinus]|uniref:CLUMA_CG003161, isoform A n=1 Tax=Clunio marinus TaxID=568069 RepID=A0A1J1HPU0_9DIPT|nr:CLUMA_CG003161, isoform A [Clunio marinus]
MQPLIPKKISHVLDFHGKPLKISFFVLLKNQLSKTDFMYVVSQLENCIIKNCDRNMKVKKKANLDVHLHIQRNDSRVD